MSMFAKVAAFEAKFQLRSPLFLVSFALFFLLTFAAATIDEIQIGSAGQVFKNAPFALLQTVGIMNLFGIFVVTAFVANAVIRDDETGFAPILRATRITKPAYVLGRFSGATLVAFLVMVSVPLGLLLGSVMPWQDPEKIGPFVLSHYLYALFVVGLPTVMLMAGAFFALATATRSMMWSYVGVIGFLVLYTVSRVVLRDPSQEQLASLLDPFGVGALFQVTKYWTVADRNQLLPPLEGVWLYNRLLWLGVSLVLLGLAYRVFRMETRSTSAKPEKATAAKPAPQPKALAQPRSGAGLQALWALTRFDMAFVFKSPAFAVLLALGLFNSFGALSGVTEMRGIPYFPVTRAVVEALTGAFSIIPIIIAIYYGGELVWRDRERRIHEIVDASAAPNWAFVVPKVLAIALVLLATLLVAVVAGVLFQLYHGYTQVQWSSYLLWFVLPTLIGTLQVGILSVFVQAIVPSKPAGWAAMLVYLVASVALATTGFEHKLYNFGDALTVPLSDMNGLGHFWIGRAWHQVYWSAFALMLVVGAHLLWRRGSETRLRPRLALAPKRLRGSAGVVLSGLMAVWLGSGAFVFYNSNVLNRYVTGPELEERRAEAEKALLPLEATLQPTITHVSLDVALYPRERLAVTQGHYTVENRHAQAVNELLVQTSPDLKLERLEMPGATLKKEYRDYGFRIYSLASPMQPGEKRELRFATRLQEVGFPNSGAQTRLVANGSFVDNFEVAPTLGVSRQGFLQDRAKRRKHGLPPELRPAPLEDDAARAHHYLRRDSDWVTADIRLSTDADQTPVAPGMTVSDTTASGRRTLVTRTEAPIQNFFSLQSARYAVKTDTWQNPQGEPVQLALYHHPEHAHNAQRMLDAMKVSLEVFSERFSPYQFKQARILEFPAYATFAQSFANTVPYSEAIGFIQNFNDEDREEKIDLVTYVTAHEIAHQWWAHQVIGADKQGMTLLSETFSQYSALLVMEKLYGKAQIRKFLKTELDNYLRSRGRDVVEEQPLARVENQDYIHYNKGAVAMYGLKEIVGEAAVNRALQKLIAEFAFKPAPYPDSRDFLRLLRAELGPQHEQLVVDLFERITLYDLKALEPRTKPLADGRFETRFTVQARKLYADGKGQETEAPLNEAFEIGGFTAEPGKKGFKSTSILSLERRPLQGGRQEVVLVTSQRPAWVGIDPFNLRIDRNSDDNLAKVPD
ncbi:MAG: M1 family aminopeptidase [Inhella sp.]|uniref:ABC transporter permease/M1 family aminopeptidase n=2 Tax=Inhella sp. TaxID=1921806 RepID=UPI0022BF46FB|nr:M1 family aminopeptidase [Inhella sp.]MCZ8235214.1 M1 family aminopeptidase [Inhella sp.]